MLSSLSSRTNKLKLNKPPNKRNSIIFASVFALIGVIAIVSSFAATSTDTKVVEAETATRTGAVKLASDPNASGSSYLSFGAPEAPIAASWQEAWDTRDYGTIQAWYRANTGINAAGLTDADLTPSGSISTTSDGQVIEGLLVSGTINIVHKDVVIRNTKVVRGGDFAAIIVPWTHRDIVNQFTLENVSAIGTTVPEYTQAIKANYAPIIARNVYVDGFGGGFFMSSEEGDIIEYSMIENIKTHPGSHNTGMSTRGGNNKLVSRNWIEGSSSSALSLYPDERPVMYFTSSENIFDGGSYSVLGGDGKSLSPQSTYIAHKDNLFTRNHVYGPYAAFDKSIEGREWSGNLYLDGELIP